MSIPRKEIHQLMWSLDLVTAREFVENVNREYRHMQAESTAILACKERLFDSILRFEALPDFITLSTMRNLHHLIFQGGRFNEKLLASVGGIDLELLYKTIANGEENWEARWEIFMKRTRSMQWSNPPRRVNVS